MYDLLRLVMANADLDQLCKEEADSMLKFIVQCKHVVLLPMQTSWSKANFGRIIWSCHCYGVCVFPSISVYSSFYNFGFSDVNVLF